MEHNKELRNGGIFIINESIKITIITKKPFLLLAMVPATFQINPKEFEVGSLQCLDATQAQSNSTQKEDSQSTFKMTEAQADSEPAKTEVMCQGLVLVWHRMQVSHAVLTLQEFFAVHPSMPATAL